MFRGLINDAKTAVGEIVASYATRAVIGVLFLLAIGFALAAITVQLVGYFGAIAAYWMIAASFAIFGLIAIAAENWRVKDEVVPERTTSDDVVAAAASTATDAAVQLPIALLGTFLTSSSGPLSLLGILRVLGRNKSLIVLAALIAVLFWPTGRSNDDSVVRDTDGPVPQPAPAE